MHERFKTMRLKAGFKVRQVAERLVVKHATVYAWESGVKFPEPANLRAVMDMYGATDTDRAEIAQFRAFGPDVAA